MNQSDTTPPSTANDKFRPTLIHCVIIVVAIGLLGWLLISKQNGYKNSGQVEIVEDFGQNEPISFEQDVSALPVLAENTDICGTHPEYCRNPNLIKTIDFIDPVYPELDETDIAPNVVAKITNRDTAPRIEFYEKSGARMGIPALDQLGIISYASEKSILVEVGVEEGESTFYYYDGASWKKIWDDLSLDTYIEHFYFSKKPIYHELTLSKNGILKMQENAFYVKEYGVFDDERDRERLYSLGNYTFLFDINKKEILGYYLGNTPMNERVSKLTETNKQFLNLISKESDICTLHPEYCNAELPNVMSTMKPVLFTQKAARYCFQLLEWEKEGINKDKKSIEECKSEHLERVVTPDVKAVVSMKEGTVIADEDIFNISFHSIKTGKRLDIPSFSGIGYVYYLNSRNILVSPVEVDWSYSQPISEFYYYDGASWQDLSFVQDLVSDLYFSEQLGDGDFLHRRNFDVGVMSGRFIVGVAEWYSSPEIRTGMLADGRDANREALIGSYRFWVDIKNKKIVGAYIGNDNLKSNIIQKNNAVQSFLELIK